MVERLLNFATPLSVLINLLGGFVFHVSTMEGEFSMIELRNVVKRYGSLVVLDDVSLQIPTHQITSFIGPNGAGKSTLLSVISRLIRMDGGEVCIDEVGA